MLSILAGYHRKTKEEPGLLKKARCMLEEQAFHLLKWPALCGGQIQIENMPSKIHCTNSA
jgi:hypothetical protein